MKRKHFFCPPQITSGLESIDNINFISYIEQAWLDINANVSMSVDAFKACSATVSSTFTTAFGMLQTNVNTCLGAGKKGLF